MKKLIHLIVKLMCRSTLKKNKPKVTDNSKWAHVSCINWTPGLFFADDEQYIVEGVVAAERFGHE
jgi:hypothetical protein